MKGLDLEGMTAKRVEFDTTEVISSFNYNLSVETDSGTFVITVLPSLSAKRIQLPFGPLEFGQFVRQCQTAHERWMQRNEDTEKGTENGS